MFRLCQRQETVRISANLLSWQCNSKNYHNLTCGFKNKIKIYQSPIYTLRKKYEDFRYKGIFRNGSTISMAYTSFKQTVPESVALPPIVIMHGLLGSKQNWKTLGKLFNIKTGRTVYLVDARNHGESPHTTDFDYYKLGEDILYFLKEHSISKACLMGHSMGGRAVMTVALRNPSVIEKLFVLDISPIGTAEDISSTPKYMERMKLIVVPEILELHEARKYVDKLLEPVVSDASVRLFLLQNLTKTDGNQFAWRVNLDAILKNFNQNIANFPPAKDGKPFDGETYFIGGSLSDYLKPSDQDGIKLLFPNAKFSYIEGAGHWLHADKPKEFMEIVTRLL